MKAYKEYMDRIRLDDDQHQKLLSAISEAEKAAKEVTRPLPEEKVRDKEPRPFPLKRFGVLASAAALALIILSLGTGGRIWRSADQDHEAILSGKTDTVTAGDLSAAPDNEKEGNKTEEEFFRNEADQASALTYHAASAEPEANTELALPGLSGFGTGAPAPVTIDFGSGDIPLLDRALSAMKNEAEPEKADVRFSYKDTVFSYSADDGTLWAGGRSCVLTDEDKAALNELIRAYEEDKPQ